MHRDSIYCVAYHVGKSDIRTFVLDRMRDTECATTERFDLPPDFQIESYFQGEFGIWKDAKPHKVVIDFDAKAAEYVRMRKVHASQKLASIANNGVRLTMTVGNLNQVVSWVLEWGARAKVIEPEELADRVREELEGALALYADAPKRARKAPKK
jgi:predicted DNA-binding transcriptional regulator YafY